jgi:hypothetical protein
MMKNKKLLIAILLISLLLITSCKEGEKKKDTKGAFIGGSQGITANFEAFGVEEDEVYSIFDTETFPIEVTLHNKGEYEIQPNDIVVNLLGPSQSEFSGISSWEKNNQDLVDKISDLVPTGGEETITFGDDVKYTNVATGLTERIWFANIDYNYKTFVLVPEVCLKEDLRDKRVCTVKENKQFSVSGAPIQVDSVLEDTAGKGIMALRFKIKNSGNGKVTKLDGEFGVSQRLTYSLDDADWECKSGGKVNEARLIDGQAEIVCKLKTALAKSHISTKQVKLTLDYKYRDIIQEKLRIKESAE